MGKYSLLSEAVALNDLLKKHHCQRSKKGKIQRCASSIPESTKAMARGKITSKFRMFVKDHERSLIGRGGRGGGQGKCVIGMV